ncbi:MAG: hypothetical protein IJZ80_08410 [Clostridia bacterium]|nr:hypothetical protein [Clostridia bacterium]
MDEKFNTVLSIALIPQILSLMIEKEGLDELSAINAFYQSQTYGLLEKEETKTWHYSPLTVYMMWKHEQETGEIIFPEEAQ